jgi:titin
MKIISFLIIALLSLPAPGWAQSLIEEHFDYAADATNGLSLQSGGVWSNKNTGDSVLVTTGSLSYSGLAASAGNKISFGGQPSGYYRTFTGQDAGTVYVSFAFRVDALPSATTGDYFIFLGNSTAVAAPVYLRASATAGKFNIGLAKRNKLTPTWMDADLSTATTYYLVFAITYVDGTKNDVCKLWLDPAAGDEPAADISITNGADITVFKNMNRVIIDHSATANDGLQIDLDELRVTTAWPALSAVSVPATPSALTATAASSSSVNLSWTDNSGDETGFRLERSTDDVNFASVATLAANTTTYADGGLTAATTYYYRVLATGAPANSAYSDTAQATTQATASLPKAPSALTATAASSSSIDLAWTDNSGDETGFQVERSVNNISFDTIATLAANTATYTDDGLGGASTYYYRVLATGASGNSGYSDTAQATTQALPEGMLIQEPFGYPADGGADLAVQSAGIWSGSGGGDPVRVTQGSLVYPGLPASGGNKIALDGSSAGYFRNFAGQTSGTVYTSFIFSVSKLPDATTGDYFIYMGNSSAVTAPVYLRKSSTAGKFNLGLAKRNNLAPDWLDQDLDLNTAYYLVFAITYVDGTKNDICSLWLDPAAGAQPAASLTVTNGADMNNFKNLNRVILNHSADGNAGLQMTLDELRVTDEWLSLAKVVLPAAPSELTAAAASSTAVNLSWKDNSDNETGFDIERSTDNVSFSLLTTLEAGSQSYTDKGLTAGTTYYYRIRAVIAGGGSGYSDTASATPAVRVPAKPSGLQAVAPTSSAVNLTWTDNSANETGFVVERSGDDAVFTVLSTVGAGTVSYQDGTVAPLTTYYYRVAAKGADGNSAYSDTAGVKTPAHIPDIPSAFTATPDSTGAIVLSWTESSADQTGFALQRSSDSVVFTTIATPAPGDTSFRDAEVRSSTRYYYRILATGENGNSPYSGIVAAVTVTTAPAAPAALTATALSANAVQLVWTDRSDNETWFELERSTDGTSFTLAATPPAGSQSYTDQGLEASTTYYYRVRATGIGGSSAYSDTASATTEVQPHDKITAGNMLTPNGDGKNDRWVIGNIGQYPDNEVTVFDRSGRVVFHRKNYSNTWNGSRQGYPLPSGAYIYVINPGPGLAPVKGILTIIHDR